ncbi:hypothetical protein GM3708_1706 [Geminocystis sp. NIES-3708]|uniref:hypothetical protein n=1 Tax=Geminocystis sp. NIES-3708 TaxID=1615909 RepID=UPI0005FCC354|nr:hypothetical protein [Geminocystis sp. NIES-3708]BAQ61300.1 hypothetical protein GM3708_1706 [Geminocystis sp. NIES-3708]
MIEKKNVSNANQAIETYIERVTELSQLGQKIPTNEELLTIASELGISDKEIASAQKQSQAHFIRAQGYVTLRHWDDAILELEEALAFNPFNLSMLHLLINAYLGRWKAKHNKQDEELIKFRVKQCLEIQPDDQESLKLLAKLDQLINNYKYQLWGITAFSLIAIGSGIGFFLLNNISLNLFSQNDKKIQSVKEELFKEIKQLKDEQKILYDQLSEKVKIQEEIDKDSQLQIEILKNEVQKLNQQNQELNNKLNNQHKSIPDVKSPKINNKTETKSL